MIYFVVSIIIASFLGYSLQQGQNVSQNTSQDTKNPAVTPRNPTAGCVCVPYYLCNNDSITNTDGVHLIDIRVNEDDGECSGYLDVCCLLPNVTQVPMKPKPVEHTRSGCGYRNEGGVGFRITGNIHGAAQYGEFPWMVAMLKEGKRDGSDKSFIFFQCGGALIHPQAVLTAGHCVSGRLNSFKIRAGEWALKTTRELYLHQDRNVKAVERHPDYVSVSLWNDIAVLILDEPFQLTETIDVICLPAQGEVIPEGTRCFASGWGKDVFGQKGKYQDVLKRVELPVVEREKCQTSLRTTRLEAFFLLHKSFICAGGEPGIDTCKGDGGSPLVCPIPGHEGRYQHAGIVAWGIGCGENNVPGVYANVALFRNWIDEQIKKHNLDTKSYNY